MSKHRHWLKLYHLDAIADEGLGLLDFGRVGVWFRLFCLAGKCNDRGRLTIRQGRCRRPLTDDEIAHLIRANSTELFQNSLRTLLELSLLSRTTGGMLYFRNWRKYQPYSDLSATPNPSENRNKSVEKPSENGRPETDTDTTETEAETKKKQPCAGKPARRKVVYSDDFKTFWKAYPSCRRKASKTRCFTVWKRSGLGDMLPQVLAAIKQDLTLKNWQELNIPAPLVWLNQERWDRDLSETSGGRDAAPTLTPEESEAQRLKYGHTEFECSGCRDRYSVQGWELTHKQPEPCARCGGVLVRVEARR